MSRRVLIVDPEDDRRQSLVSVAAQAGCDTTTRATFSDARQELAAGPYDVLITGLKLGSFNGIHLVYLAHQANPACLCIVHSDDFGSGFDAQKAGAFWERSPF